MCVYFSKENWHGSTSTVPVWHDLCSFEGRHMGKFGFERGVAVLQQVNIGPHLSQKEKKKLSAYSTKAKNWAVFYCVFES